MSFKIGDRVVHTENFVIPKGYQGTVVHVGKDLPGIRWDQKIRDGHTCDGKCEDGHGWYVQEEHLSIISFEIDEDGNIY